MYISDRVSRIIIIIFCQASTAAKPLKRLILL